MVARNSTFDGLEMTHDFDGRGRRTLLVGATRPARARRDAGGSWSHIRDITELGAFHVHDRARSALCNRLFESSADGLVLANADSGAILESNDSMAVMMGCTTAEVRLVPLSRLPLSTQDGQLPIDLDELRKTGSLHTEACVLTSRAGVRRDVNVRLRLHLDVLGPIVEVEVREAGAAGAGNGPVLSSHRSSK